MFEEIYSLDKPGVIRGSARKTRGNVGVYLSTIEMRTRKITAKNADADVQIKDDYLYHPIK